MISRVVLGVVLAATMVVVGPATYIYLGSKTSRVSAPPAKPTAATPRAQAFSLPGTLYISQGGAIYSLSAGRFHQLTNEDGWTQPSVMPDGNLLVIRRQPFYSDLWVINGYGTAVRKLTSNSAPNKNSDPGLNHWVFYPRVSADGKTIWLAYDKPKYGYDVVMSIWAMPAGGPISQGRLWTNAADYAGGDVQPVPVKGGIIYTKYDFASRYDPNEDSKLVGMLWFTNRAYSVGKQLTSPGDDCREPTLSPDGTQIAMICTYQKQVSYLEIASWNGSTLGRRTVVINDQLVAQPVWAPDGSGIAYLAPGVASGEFQLWFVPRALYAPAPSPSPTPTPGGPHNGALASPSPPQAVKPIQITTNNGFDATSPIAWR